MSEKKAMVVTTINAATAAMQSIQRGAQMQGANFYVIGDTKSPADFSLAGARYFDVAQQRASGLRFADACPTQHYARKNIGYLLAMRDGADLIVETDDDNFPMEGFWAPRTRELHAALVSQPGWCNVYGHFSDTGIWPRGLPLERIKDPVTDFGTLPMVLADCPIQQGLADANPDVDAIYRLLRPLPIDFIPGRTLVLEPGVWCPFNSQNTTWWRDAFALLYLPATCSFRMTDIWRSFVAQRIAWENGWRIAFHSSTVYQERNEHDLMRDFADEVSGYLNNARIGNTLDDLVLERGVKTIADNLRTCYQALVKLEVIAAAELPLLDAWLEDVARYA
jgi:hypothetical protein